jgi:hypothetical protein
MAYIPPEPSDLKAKYPAFAAVADDTIDLWLEEAATETSLFPEDYRARAELAYAAHMMATTTGVLTSAIPAGVTAFRSADFSASIAEGVASRTGFSATTYGQEYIALRRRFFGGPMLIGSSCV